MYFLSHISIHAFLLTFPLKFYLYKKIKLSIKDFLLLIYTFKYVYDNISKDNNYKFPKSPNPGLGMACNRYTLSWNGHSKVVSTLAANNASLDIQKFYKDNPRETEVLGETAMMLAASYGHNDVVSTLLAHNASVNIQNKSGVTALVLAARNGHTDVVSTLHRYTNY